MKTNSDQQAPCSNLDAAAMIAVGSEICVVVALVAVFIF